MKFYLRDPARALEGMQGLTLEQAGAYNLLLDHLYCRDGVLPDDDELIRAMLNLDPRRWRRLRTELIQAGKIRITIDGLIEANGVTSTLVSAEARSKAARHAVTVRWRNHREKSVDVLCPDIAPTSDQSTTEVGEKFAENPNQINGTAIQARNTSRSIINTKNSSTSSNAGAEPAPNGAEPNLAAAAPAAVVARTGSSGSSPVLTTTTALEASLRKKGWI